MSPRLTTEALDLLLKAAQREGYIKACMETGPRPTTLKQEEHFRDYYTVKATIAIP
jgi:hypothetical protein